MVVQARVNSVSGRIWYMPVGLGNILIGFSIDILQLIERQIG